MTKASPQRYHDGVTQTREILWPSAESPLYRLTLELDEVAGRLECVGVSVRAQMRGRVVSGTTMRELPLGRLVAEEVRQLRVEVSSTLVGAGDLINADQMPNDFLRNRGAFWSQAKVEADILARIIAKSGPAARGRRYPNDHLEKVAAVYREALRWHRNPTATVGEHFGVTRSAAAKWVSRARQRAFLPPARRGRADPPDSSALPVPGCGPTQRVELTWHGEPEPAAPVADAGIGPEVWVQSGRVRVRLSQEAAEKRVSATTRREG